MRRRIIISWHRFYDPSTGRYISADPIGLAGGINLYSYANQNPINFIDPKGLFSTFGAVWHYFTGNGQTVNVNFSEVDIGLSPKDFQGYTSLVQSMYKKQGTKPVDLRKSKDIGGWAGHTTYRLKGKITSDTCKWEFEGYIGAFDDTFDFNSMPWGTRDYWKEIVTRLIGYIPGGQTYDIHYAGRRQVKDGGTW